jgi:hypothetical protein
VKAYHARHNPTLAAIEDGLRKSAIESLRCAGMPEANLTAPINLEVGTLVQELVEGCRLALRYRWESITDDILQRSAPLDGERYNRELCARVIAATGHALGSPGHETTAEYLNDGIPSGKPGLKRHHVMRAVGRWNKMLERIIKLTGRSLPVSIIVELMWEDFVTVRALDIVYQQARARPEFRTHRGEDLAWAVHNQFDLNERIHRAADWVRAKRPPLLCEIPICRAPSFAPSRRPVLARSTSEHSHEPSARRR